MGFESANPHKYWVFIDQIGFSKVGRKWANGQKIDHFYPNSTNFRPYHSPQLSKTAPKSGQPKTKVGRKSFYGYPILHHIIETFYPFSQDLSMSQTKFRRYFIEHQLIFCVHPNVKLSVTDIIFHIFTSHF